MSKSVLSIIMAAQAPAAATAVASQYTIIKGSNISNTDSYLLQFDGLSEPNPGASSGGAVLYAPDGSVVFEAGEFIPHATNNQAEYSGLILGLMHTKSAPNLRIEGDSMLIINQVSGKWKIKNDVLKSLHSTVMDILRDSAFVNVGIRHVYRDQNKHADKLTNDVMKTRCSFYKCS
jgi:ribonuclease HI